MESKKNVVVIGGAGLWGSEVAAQLASNGQSVVTFDSLITGKSERIKFGPLVKADAKETPRLVQTFQEYLPTEVHVCCLSAASATATTADSENHVAITLSVLKAACQASGPKLVFHLPKGLTTSWLERMIADSVKAYSLQIETRVF